MNIPGISMEISTELTRFQVEIIRRSSENSIWIIPIRLLNVAVPSYHIEGLIEGWVEAWYRKLRNHLGLSTNGTIFTSKCSSHCCYKFESRKVYLEGEGKWNLIDLTSLLYCQARIEKFKLLNLHEVNLSTTPMSPKPWHGNFLAGLAVIGLYARAICSSSGGCRLRPLRCKKWLNEVQRKARTWLWIKLKVLERFKVGKFLAAAASKLPRNTARTSKEAKKP